MQAVVLAAGRGTRMDELTSAVPKPMLDVAGKPLLEYKLDALPDAITEVVLIIGYKKEVVRNHFGAKYERFSVRYVEQEELDGTAGALWRARNILQERFLIMMGDDIYAKEDVERMIEPSEHWKLLVQELPEMHRAGRVVIGEDAMIADIIESSEEDALRWQKGVASTNCYCLDTRLFTQELVPKHPGSSEWGLPQTVAAAAKQLGVPFEPVFTEQWIQITSPGDLVMAAELLKKLEK